ncbi:DUF4105 domain-containing protein [bacterium]|nr:DUF4105 domain-containing protein [bacterium]
MKGVAYLIAVFAIAGMLGWATLAIYFSALPPAVRIGAAVLFVICSMFVLAVLRPIKKGVLVFCSFFMLVMIGWLAMEPSHERNWQSDVSFLPHATFEGDMLTMHNIRTIDYRSETDYDLAYYNKTYDLKKLRSLDLFLSDWGLKIIVHTLVSFGFEDGSYLCISVEARKEEGETYSNLKGFFRQYELIYVVADERDLVRLRTNYRVDESVYLYRFTGVPQDVVSEVLVDYVRYINELYEQPQWYNALTANCTSQIHGHTRPYARKVWWDWRLLANGYVDELAYDAGVLDRSLPFAELKERSVINDRARRADSDLLFSRRIREGLPGMTGTLP